MMKASRFIFVPFALGIIGMASIAIAQEPVQLKFSRVVDLTLPIETNMAGIPGFKIYADGYTVLLGDVSRPMPPIRASTRSFHSTRPRISRR